MQKNQASKRAIALLLSLVMTMGFLPARATDVTAGASSSEANVLAETTPIKIEAESGTYLVGTEPTKAELQIASEPACSGGEYLNNIDQCGKGGGAVYTPGAAGTYTVSLCFGKGQAEPVTGSVVLYQNETQVGSFSLKQTVVNPNWYYVLAPETYEVTLEAEDTLSLRVDQRWDKTTHAYNGVARLDYLELKPVSTEQHTVTIDTPLNGVLTVRSGASVVGTGDKVRSGTELTIAAEPESGYVCKNVTVDGEVLSGNTVTVTKDITIAAAFEAEGEKPADATAWGAAVHVELETGTVTKGDDAIGDATVVTNGTFSGGKYIDTLNKCGKDASITVLPTVEADGYYKVSLSYAKGGMYPTGKVGFYQNETKIGDFNLVGKDVNKPVYSSDTYIVKISPGDALSIRSDSTTKIEADGYTDAVARLDRLELQRWGGKAEAESSMLLQNEISSLKITAKEGASGGSVVSGFTTNIGDSAVPHVGTGVSFPGLTAPADDSYLMNVRYLRSGSYEYETVPSLYVNDTFLRTVTLSANQNTDTFYTSDPVELTLNAGDVISIRIDGKGAMKDDFGLDYITLDVKPADKPIPGTTARFESNAVCVVNGATFRVPTLDVPAEAKLSYSSSATDIATVDANTGVIAAKAVGAAMITATNTVDNATFTTDIQVVSTADDMETEPIRKEAELGELLAGATGQIPVIANATASQPYSGGKYVGSFHDEGTGAGIKFANPVAMAGTYRVWIQYNKGQMYNPCSMTLYHNGGKVGKFTLRDTQNSFAATVPSNVFVLDLKAGDIITVQRDADDDPLFRFDYLALERITTIPASAVGLTGITMAEKEKVALVPTLTPEKANDVLLWTSSDPGVVRVDGGVLTGVSIGSAIVTATSRYFDGVSANCTVTVGANVNIETLTSDTITVSLDKTFPRVIAYKMNATGNTMDGNFTPLSTLLVNGKVVTPTVTFTRVSAAECKYDLAIAELNATIHMTAKAEKNLFKLDVTGITEDGAEDKRVFTIEIPNLNIVSAASSDVGAQFAGANMENNITRSGDTILDLNAVTGADMAAEKYMYAFLSNGTVAAGVNSNAFGNEGTQHLTKQTVAEGSGFRTGLSSIAWIYRKNDYKKLFQDLPNRYPSEQGENMMVNKTYKSEPEAQKPLLHVALTEECNGDSTVNWQDAAVAYRAISHHVKDEEKVPDMVVQRLVQQQAGSGNYPFISMLDETRRVSLNTDNMGQMINDKFHNEAYWGDFTHYDDHLGGWRDFNKMVTDSTHKYNGYVGVHSNFYEYFAKVEQFSPELTSMKADGITPNNKGYKAYGAWMHQCYNIDTTADTLSGDRLRRMKIFKEDVPDLGFIYNDVWYNNGWEGLRIGEDYRNADIGYCVEWPYVNFEDSIWSHWAVERGYGGRDNKGVMSDIMRFVWNDTRDRWDNNDHPDEPNRTANARNLLIGADTTTYEGWQNNSTNRYDRVMEKIFENNLPTKFMQHFPITRMEKDAAGFAKHIWFEDGVEAYYEGSDPWNRVLTVNGQIVYNKDTFLLPWDDGTLGGTTNLANAPTKFYHWSNAGGSSTWTLPVAWTGTLYLYELSDQGKGNEQTVTVSEGKITLTNVKADTPYVLYQAKQVTGNDTADFGEGGYVNDPGFNYGDLREWTVDQGTAEVKRNYSKGDDPKFVINQFKGELRNYELIMENAAATQVSQVITGLTPGESYAVTAMVEVEHGKERRATLAVDCGGTTSENYVDSSILINTDIYDSKANTYMLRIRTEFTVPSGVTEATIRLRAAADSGAEAAIVRFDNIRVYDCTIKTGADYVPTAHADGSAVTGEVISYQDYESTSRKADLIQNKNGRDALKNEFEVTYPLVLGQGQMSGEWAQQFRSFLVSKHEPYTQNGLTGSQWDPNTTGTDDVLAGDRTLRIYGAPLGVAYQTIPQTVRFETGHTYKVSFLYEYRKEREGDLEFVVGEGSIPRNQSHNPQVENIKIHTPIAATSPATSEATRIGKFVTTFTANSDQTWIGINRAVYFDLWEDPCPFQIDNLLIEDMDKEPILPTPTYTVTVKNGIGGDSYAKDDVVTITATVPAGQRFVNWTTADEGVAFTNAKNSTTSFVMPDHAVTVTANFENIPSIPDYNPPQNTTSVTVRNEDGSTTKTVTNKKTGEVVATTTYLNGTKVVTTTPKDGASTTVVTLPDGKDETTVTIPMPNATAGTVAVIVHEDGTEEIVKASIVVKDGIRVRLEADATLKFKDNAETFADVKQGDWYADSVAFATSHELFNGVGAGAFAPSASMTRGMLTTVLQRLSGDEITEGKTWYSASVDWAKEKGISDGSNPSEKITRESLVVMLYRYAKAETVTADLPSLRMWAKYLTGLTRLWAGLLRPDSSLVRMADLCQVEMPHVRKLPPFCRDL